MMESDMMNMKSSAHQLIDQTQHRALSSATTAGGSGVSEEDTSLVVACSLLGGLFFVLPFCARNRVLNRYRQVPEGTTRAEHKRAKSLGLNRLLHLSNCFAGGVLFSLAIVKLYPQAMEAYKVYLEHRGVSLGNNSGDLKEDGFGQRFPFILSLIFIGFILKLVLQLCVVKKSRFNQFTHDPDQLSSDGSDKGSLNAPDQHLGELVTQRSEVQTEQLDARALDSEQMEGGDYEGRLNSDNFGRTESVGVVSPSLRQRFQNRSANQLPEIDSQSAQSARNNNEQNRVGFYQGDVADPNQVNMLFCRTESVRSGGSIKTPGSKGGTVQEQAGAPNPSSGHILRQHASSAPYAKSQYDVADEKVDQRGRHLLVIAMFVVLFNIVNGITTTRFKGGNITEGSLALTVLVQAIGLSLAAGSLFIAAEQPLNCATTVCFILLFIMSGPISLSIGASMGDKRIGLFSALILALICGAFIHHSIVSVIIPQFFLKLQNQSMDLPQLNNKRTKVQKILVILFGCSFAFDYFKADCTVLANFSQSRSGKPQNAVTVPVIRHCALLDDQYSCLRCLDGFTLQDNHCLPDGQQQVDAADMQGELNTTKGDKKTEDQGSTEEQNSTISVATCSLLEFNDQGACKSCASVLSNCQICDDANTCTQCHPEFELQGGRCTCPGEGRVAFVGSDGEPKCRECSSLINHCEQCANPHRCTKCSGSAPLMTGHCGCRIDKCETCLNHNQCHKCLPGFINQGNKCAKCSAGQYHTSRGCIKHLENCESLRVGSEKTDVQVLDSNDGVRGFLKCEQCNHDSFPESSSKCTKCVTRLANCDRCTPDGGFCLRCHDGYKSTATGCQKE